jgi:uncharacterized membrane protein
MGSLLDTVNGLPLHPVVVHAVVVLLPLTAVLAVLMVINSRFSRRFGPIVMALGLCGVAASVLAKESGEQLMRHVESSPTHVQLGSRTPIYAGLYFLLLLGFWLVDRGIPGNRRRPASVVILGVLLVFASVLICIQVYLVGHSGAEVVWLQMLSGTP